MKEGENIQLSLLQFHKKKHNAQIILNKPPFHNESNQKSAKITRSHENFHSDKIKQEQIELQTKVSRKSMDLQRVITQQYQCSICCKEIKSAQTKTIPQCEHRFCKECLNQYIKICIQTFSIAKCPYQQCGKIICSQFSIIGQMSPQQKQKYTQIQIFFKMAKDKSNKLCPTQNCKGTINMQFNPSKCQICNQQFCSICLLKFHQGNCDQNSALHLHSNYRYQRCVKCKMIVQKNKGCHHITCKCGHQFCYVCGVQWIPQHHCPQMDLFPIQVQQVQLQQLNPQQQSFRTKFCRRLKQIIKIFFIIFICLSIILIFLPLDLPFCILFTILKAIKHAFKYYAWYEIIFANVLLLLFCMVKVICTEGCHGSCQSKIIFYIPISSQIFICITERFIVPNQD